MTALRPPPGCIGVLAVVSRRRSVLVQLGLGGDVSIPQNLVVSKEIEMKGTFRFHEEFALAVDLINAGRVDLKPLMSGVYPIEEAVAAFDAADRNGGFSNYVVVP